MRKAHHGPFNSLFNVGVLKNDKAALATQLHAGWNAILCSLSRNPSSCCCAAGEADLGQSWTGAAIGTTTRHPQDSCTPEAC